MKNLKALVLLLALPLLAVTQPMEHTDDAHCHAATQADDNPAIVVWCTSAAEDHVTDAEGESGDSRAIDLVMGAMQLLITALAHREMGDSNYQYLVDNARQALQEAAQAARSNRVILLVQHAQESLP